MKLLKYVFAWLLSAMFCLIPLTGRSAAAPAAADNSTALSKPKQATDLFGDAVVAKGKGFEIKRSQLDDEVIRLKGMAAARNQAIPPEQSAALEKQVLEQLIQIQLLQSKATDADKAAGKELAQKRLAEAKSQLGSDEAFDRRLKSEGLTRDQLVNKWTDAGTAETVVKRELKANITEDEAKKYYEDNPARFEEPEKVRSAHILLSTRDPATNAELPEDKKAAKRKQIDDLLKRARAGEDFGKLAREFSEDPGSKDKGGEYTFPRGQMMPEFEAAAFSLNTNQVSDVVTTPYGFHIIKLYEKIPAHKEPYAGLETKTVYAKADGAKATVKDVLADTAMQKQFPDFMRSLRKEAGVEILDDKLKMEELPPTSNPPPGAPAPASVPKQ
jgi:parvulin-like peptidyl-prolyl isomerase